jgi:glycosyltransferase involved in cell wall biosynthesis
MGLDLELLRVAREAPTRFAQSPSIAVVGRLTADKNLDLIVQAFVQVRRRIPTATLTFIGSPVSGDRPWEVPREPNIEHIPWVANPYPLIAGADVLVSGSRREGFPLGVAEALAMNVPVVAVANRGTRQQHRDHPSGLRLVAPRPSAMAEALIETLSQRKPALVEPPETWSQDSAIAFHTAVVLSALPRSSGESGVGAG